MQIKAEAKYIKQGPRKVRLVADLVRPMSLAEALTTLKHLRRRAAAPVLKVLKQAVANATNNLKIPASQLIIDRLEVNAGPTMKRFRIGDRGRGKPVLKRTSRVTVHLKTKGEIILKTLMNFSLMGKYCKKEVLILNFSNLFA